MWLFVVMTAIIVVASCENNRPVIGVVAQSTDTTDWKNYGDSFIQYTYVNFIEMAGARVVPVKINENTSYYEDLFKRINGIIFPGGSANLEASGYAHVGQHFYPWAKKAFDEGDHFPIWGTCNGFELLATLTANKIPTVPCDAENLTLPLTMEADYKQSRLFKDLPDDLAASVAAQPLTQNYHHYCVSTQGFSADPEVKNFYNLLSTNKDRNGLTFVSTMEGKTYPFYATQFHPEKSVFNWQLDLAVNRSFAAVKFAQYLANFFVEEARKSNHHFESPEEEAEASIQSYQPTFLGSPDFFNIYFFQDDTLTLIIYYRSHAGAFYVLLTIAFILSSMALLLYVARKVWPHRKARKVQVIRPSYDPYGVGIARLPTYAESEKMPLVLDGNIKVNRM